MSNDRSLLDDLKALEVDGLSAVASARDARELESVRIEYLGRKDGKISLILRHLGEIPAE